MARKTKSSKDAAETTEEIVETTDKDQDAAAGTDAKDQVSEAAAEAEASVDTSEPTPDEDTVEVSDAEDGPEVLDDEPSTDITEEIEPAAPVVEQTVIRKGGFVPMVLGGAVAAAIGFGATQYYPLQDLFGSKRQGADLQAEMEQKLQKQTETLDDLTSQIRALSDGPDLSSFEADQSDQAAAIEALASRIDASESMLSKIESRLSEVEKRPLGEAASDAAVAAYERELKALQESMSAQRAEIEAMATGAREMEENAHEAAVATMRRAALTRIQSALDNGTAFSSALVDLETTGVAIPSALSRAADTGVASLTDLQSSFPDAARAALSAARKTSGASDGSGGFSAFLLSQLGARSLEPQEGDHPDAILSRAEAATREGRLNDALAEIEALPEIGRAELSDWSGLVALRLEAIAAAQELGDTLN